MRSGEKEHNQDSGEKEHSQDSGEKEHNQDSGEKGHSHRTNLCVPVRHLAGGFVGKSCVRV